MIWAIRKPLKNHYDESNSEEEEDDDDDDDNLIVFPLKADENSYTLN